MEMIPDNKTVASQILENRVELDRHLDKYICRFCGNDGETDTIHHHSCAVLWAFHVLYKEDYIGSRTQS